MIYYYVATITTKEEIMKGYIYSHTVEGDFNPHESAMICVDRKVHFRIKWDRCGDPKPCDGSCLPMIELPPEAERLVLEFQASGIRETSYPLKKWWTRR